MERFPSQADSDSNCLSAKEGGLQIPLDSFDVSSEPGDPASFLGGVHSSWRISSFMAGNEYPVALVYDGLPVDLQFFILERDTQCLPSAPMAQV